VFKAAKKPEFKEAVGFLLGAVDLHRFPLTYQHAVMVLRESLPQLFPAQAVRPSPSVFVLVSKERDQYKEGFRKKVDLIQKQSEMLRDRDAKIAELQETIALLKRQLAEARKLNLSYRKTG
jgi:hypothetical protein